MWPGRVRPRRRPTPWRMTRTRRSAPRAWTAPPASAWPIGKKQNRALEKEQAAGGDERGSARFRCRTHAVAASAAAGRTSRRRVAPAIPGQPPGVFGGEMLLEQPPPPPLVVREYAHKNESAPGDLRKDFAETLLWQPCAGRTRRRPQNRLLRAVRLGDDLRGQRRRAHPRWPARHHHHRRRLAAAVYPGAQDAHRSQLGRPYRPARHGQQQHRRQPHRHPQGDGDRPGPRRQGRRRADGSRPFGRPAPVPLPPEHGRGRGAASSSAARRCRSPPTASPAPSASCPTASPIVGSQSDLLEGTRRQRRGPAGDLGQGHAEVPGAGLSLDAGRSCRRAWKRCCASRAAASSRPRPATTPTCSSSITSRRATRPGRRSKRRARDLLASRLSEADLLRVPEDGSELDSRVTSGSAAPPRRHEALTAYGLLQFRDMARVQPVDAEPCSSGRSNTCWRRATARAASRATRAPSTPSAGPPTTSPTPTSSGP